MTPRNGTGGTSDRRLHSEASIVPEQANGMEHEKDCESEEGGHGGSTAVTAAVTAPDGGWGWVVLVATIIVLALTLAFPSCVGIFYTDLQNEFDASNSETSWVPSIMTSVLHAGGPFCSVLVERFGCRATVMLGGVLSGLGMAASSFTQSIGQLYVTAGVITGLGFCFSFQPAVTILGHYFVRRRTFANAMSSTGTALGLCTLPFLGNYLHTEFGWRGSFLVLGAVLLNCCVCGAVMRPLQPRKHRGQPLMNHGPPPPEEEENVKDKKGWLRTIWSYLVASLSKHMAFDQFCNNSRYCVYAIGITWMMLGFVVPLVYLVPYATANNMEQGRAAMLLSILGIVNIVVRPGFGLIFNLPWFKGRHIYVFASALLVNGLSNSICCIGPGFNVLLTYVAFYGLSMSVVGSLMFTVLMDIVEMSRFPSALGLLAIMESITLLIGPPLAGKPRERVGDGEERSPDRQHGSVLPRLLRLQRRGRLLRLVPHGVVLLAGQEGRDVEAEAGSAGGVDARTDEAGGGGRRPRVSVQQRAHRGRQRQGLGERGRVHHQPLNLPTPVTHTHHTLGQMCRLIITFEPHRLQGFCT